MDRSLDEVITERQRQTRGRRGRGYDDGPRDGVRKPRSRDTRTNLEQEWVHDRYDGDRYSGQRGRDLRGDRLPAAPKPNTRAATNSASAKLRVENLHYDLTEKDLTDLFERIGPLANPPQILYDRSDRSRGIAFVTYADSRDAKDAVHEYDGANAYGQPIHLIPQPSGPSGSAINGATRAPGAAIGSGRSLFDRIDDRRDGSRRRVTRSESPVRRGGDRNSRRREPEYIDRYIPGVKGRARSRSPPPRRETGRRPGIRREDSVRDRERGGARGGRGARRGVRDGDGRPVVGGRPRKTAEELDAEMMDYWGPSGNEVSIAAASNTSGSQEQKNGHTNGGSGVTNGTGANLPDVTSQAAGSSATTEPVVDEDIDMIE